VPIVKFEREIKTGKVNSEIYSVMDSKNKAHALKLRNGKGTLNLPRGPSDLFTRLSGNRNSQVNILINSPANGKQLKIIRIPPNRSRRDFDV